MKQHRVQTIRSPSKICMCLCMFVCVYRTVICSCDSLSCLHQRFYGEWDKHLTYSQRQLFWKIRDAFNKFPDFFVQAFKIVVDSQKFTMLLLYILWDDWPIFIISGSNEQLQHQLEYTLLKPDCHSWWISKMQSWREETLEERYAIKLCFKLGKIPQKRME